MLKCQTCGKEFLYAAKKTTTLSPITTPTDCATSIYQSPVTIESHICPYCYGLDLREVEETQAKIESIVNVKIPEADEWIKKGYEVAGMYASTVNLVKKAKEEKK